MTDVNGERWQAEVDARLARLELRADEAELADAGLSTRASTPLTHHENHLDLERWVLDYFCTTFSRPLGGEFRWCPQWQEHREAVVRLDALWRSWMALSRDPMLGMSTWLHQFLDPQLRILLSAGGPFAQCSATRHDQLNPLAASSHL